MKSDVYQVVTDRVIMILQAGTVPWRKPWKGITQAPRNLVSRKAYRGINLFLLHAAGYASPFWLTFNQALSLGACVKKGERSLPVVFWKMLEIEEDGQKKLIPFLRYHSVFNLTQCEGVPPPFAPSTAGEIFPIGRCETVVANMPSTSWWEHVATYPSRRWDTLNNNKARHDVSGPFTCIESLSQPSDQSDSSFAVRHSTAYAMTAVVTTSNI